ncbi:MAG: SMP-30/gluconolactonase/LRE family protein [Pseudomonadota bacterium]
MSEVFDSRACELGEGPLWHPERQQFFWFDILGKKLLSQVEGQPVEWCFDEHVSVAGWVDEDTLIMASETGLWRFDIPSGTRDLLVALEAGIPATRSNDGRADPQGGFWIGTMGKSAEPKAGAIYRYYRGEVKKLVPDITVSNTICFAPEGDTAFYSDTHSRQVMRQSLDGAGWPIGKPEVFLDLTTEGRNPDGAVIDVDGSMWLAEWGMSRVAVYDRNGVFQKAFGVGGRQSSCPAFGGSELSTLYCTTARYGLADEILTVEPENGMTYIVPGAGQGQREHKVIL